MTNHKSNSILNDLKNSGVFLPLLLLVSNIFMTFAWYSHLRLQSYSWFSKLTLPLVILFSWGIALFEYCFQVPANLSLLKVHAAHEANQVFALQ